MINVVLKNQGTIIASVREHIKVPTISDYLALAKKENAKAKAQHADLDSEINNEDNITGNSRPEYKRFLIDNYKEQILKVSKGFNVRMIMVASNNLTSGQLKLMSKFKNIKTSAMARIVNKRGGYGYLSSPTRERQVKYYPLDKRFFAPVRQEKPKDLSYNEILFYSVYDLNGRALKYKKSYISNAITKATGEKASSEDVKLISDLTRNLATRYMLFGLDLNNATDFDPNVVFDYRLEALFMNKLERIEGKENNRWILPIVQELAGNMAIEFFKNAEISPLAVRDNLISASKYLPEFSRKYDGKSFAGVLFNSETSTYNLGRNSNKIKPLKKASILSRIKDKLGVITSKGGEETNNEEQGIQNEIGNEVKPTPNQPGEQGGAEIKTPKVSEVEYTLFGKKRVFKVFTFDEYCDHFAKNILEPCASDEKLPKAKEAFDKYNSFEDGALSSRERLVNALGEKTLNDFYDNYIDYTINEAKARSKNCEVFANIVTNEIIAIVDHHIEVESNIKDENGEIKDKEKVQNLNNLAEAVKNDVSLSSIDDIENLVKIVVEATKVKAESGKVVTEDITFLDTVCRKKTDKDLDSYIESLIDNYLANCKQEESAKVEDVEFEEECKKYFTFYSSTCLDKMISMEENLQRSAKEEYKQEIQKKIDVYKQINDEILHNDWFDKPEFSKLNDRYESCRDCMLENVQIVKSYICDYFESHEKAIADDMREIANNRILGAEQNAKQGNAQKGLDGNIEGKEISQFEFNLNSKMHKEVKRNSDRVYANYIIKDFPTIKVRELDKKNVFVTIKDEPKTVENVKINNELAKFYGEMDELAKNLNALEQKDNSTEHLSIAESTWLKILERKDKYVHCFEEGNMKASEQDYLFGIDNCFKFEINTILEEGENEYLATKGLTAISEQRNKITSIMERVKKETRIMDKENSNNDIQGSGQNGGHETPEPPVQPKKLQPQKMTSIEKATKVKEINRTLKKEVKVVLDEKVESVRSDMEKMNPKSKAYKFYDLYAKTFASIRRIYDPNSSNAPYKGISQETTVGIKDKIDKYIKKEIVAKITADPKFETLSVDELVKKYTNKAHLKYFVTEVIERSNSALIADNYNLDIFGRKKNVQNDKLISVNDFEQNQELGDQDEDNHKQQGNGVSANVVSEKVEEPEIVEEHQVIEEVPEQVIEEEPENVEDISEEGHKKAEEEKKAEIAKMKNLSAKGNKIKECKAIIRNDVANILSEKVAVTRDDMTRMNSKNSAYKFYDLYAKAFASVRKLYDSKASNTIYKGISEECVFGVKKNIDAYIEKEIIAKIKNDPELDNLNKEALVEKYRDMDKLKAFVIDYIENNTNTLISNSYLVNLNLSIKRKPRSNNQDSPEYVKEDIEIVKN